MNAMPTDVDAIRRQIRRQQADTAAAARTMAAKASRGDPAVKGVDGDGGPARQHANGRLEVVEAPDVDRPKSGATIRRAQLYDPVRAAVRAWTRNGRKSPYRCYLAAERFRADLAKAAADVSIPSQIRPRIFSATGGADDTDRPGVNWVAARERAAAAWRAIGLAASGVMSWCVVPKPPSMGRAFGTLEGYDECRGWRKGKASEELEAVLHRLADHYEIGKPDTPRDFS